MKHKTINRLKEYLQEARDIVIVSHSNPDGDALGSSLALAGYLRKFSKSVEVLVPNAYPDFLAWLPGNKDILRWDTDEDRCRALITKADLIFCLDFNALHRMDGLGNAISRTSSPRILIDHHINPSDEFDLQFSDVKYSSTSEMVYTLIDSMSELDRIDPDIAVNLFVGIMTDTGSFSYACSRPETFKVTADLISRGVDPEKAHRMVYDKYSENRMRLLGFSLGERMKVIPELNAAYIYLTSADLDRFSYKVGDTEGLVNYPLSIEGVNLSVLFTEKEDYIRMSLRSKGNFSVNDFVRNNFEGGGHRNAAGGNAYSTMKEALERFEAILPQYKHELMKADQ